MKVVAHVGGLDALKVTRKIIQANHSAYTFDVCLTTPDVLMRDQQLWAPYWTYVVVDEAYQVPASEVSYDIATIITEELLRVTLL